MSESRRTLNERVVAEAKKRSIGNMNNPSFIAALLQDAGVSKPPCDLCLNHVQKTCAIVVGETKCEKFALYSRSPKKVEQKILYIIQVSNEEKKSRRKRIA